MHLARKAGPRDIIRPAWSGFGQSYSRGLVRVKSMSTLTAISNIQLAPLASVRAAGMAPVEIVS